MTSEEKNTVSTFTPEGNVTPDTPTSDTKTIPVSEYNKLVLDSQKLQLLKTRIIPALDNVADILLSVQYDTKTLKVQVANF